MSFNLSQDANSIISQIGIYDQIWFICHMPENGKHSLEAVALAKDFVARLEEIPDACADCFLFGKRLMLGRSDTSSI